ncbi:MAG: glycosyltransferase family 4 protein [Bryobacteraceae bacterium]
MAASIFIPAKRGSARVVFLHPLSIVHIDTARDWRGGQEALLTLARGLRSRGHTQTIVCPSGSALAERAAAEQLPVSEQCPRIAGILHAHSGRAQNLAYWATLGWPVRRVVTRHVAFAPRHPLVHRLKYKWTCDGIIAVSDSVRRTLLDAGVPSDKIVTIHTGVEVPESLPRPARAQFGLGENDFVVGHLGAFTAEKGQDVAAAAATMLRETLPRARVVLAGEGPLKSQIADENVILPGFITDHAEFFAALDLFIMPSRSEAWGLAALEAMAHGVPVIASEIGGLAEIVDAESGWLVPPGDPAALARAILSVASNPERLRAAGLKARDRARLFSVEQMVQQTEDFYGRP